MVEASEQGLSRARGISRRKDTVAFRLGTVMKMAVAYQYREE